MEIRDPANSSKTQIGDELGDLLPVELNSENSINFLDLAFPSRPRIKLTQKYYTLSGLCIFSIIIVIMLVLIPSKNNLGLVSPTYTNFALIVQPSNTKSATPTITPVRATETLERKNITPTIVPRCIIWSKVMLSFLGQRKCVYGKVVSLIEEDGIYYIKFQE
jgi:hypothetical protein